MVLKTQKSFLIKKTKYNTKITTVLYLTTISEKYYKTITEQGQLFIF